MSKLPEVIETGRDQAVVGQMRVGVLRNVRFIR